MRTDNKTERSPEDAAEQRTTTGWCCKHCNRFWGKNEHMARYCCSTHSYCECGAKATKGWSKCDSCRDKERFEQWQAKPCVAWDGSFPVGDWGGDTYWFDEDQLRDYLHEQACEQFDCEEPTDSQLIEVLESEQVCTCEPNNGRCFEMQEYLCDDLAEDQTLDCKDIDKVVNDWIAANAPFSWSMDGGKIATADLIKALGLQLKGGEA